MNTPQTPVQAKVIKQPRKALLFWGMILASLALTSLTQTDAGWLQIDKAPTDWNWGRLVDLVLLGLGLSMIADYVHRTAAWVRTR